jgi:hypothetical protein
VDEPASSSADNRIYYWARAIHAAQPDVLVYENPIWTDPANADIDAYNECDIITAFRTRFVAGTDAYRKWFTDLRDAGKELAFYSANYGKYGDPIAFFRAEFWTAMQYGASRCLFWGFGDEAGPSWNQYLSTGGSGSGGYSPVFFGTEGTTDAKHIEAIREGAEDYELYQKLDAAIEYAEATEGVTETSTNAKAFLATMPADGQVNTTTLTPDWGVEDSQTTVLDRSTMDTLRLTAIDWLLLLQEEPEYAPPGVVGCGVGGGVIG